MTWKPFCETGRDGLLSAWWTVSGFAGFGERWGRHWLDVTYYADTTGVGRRIPPPEAWRYRDYVIQSFNDDKPYDRFVREQIAGIEDPAKSEIAATGFLVLGPWAWFSYDRRQVRLDVADLDRLSRTHLSDLTVGCARCHDHKFDPITNNDYYGMAGIFLSTKTLAPGNPEGGINTVRAREHRERLAGMETNMRVGAGASPMPKRPKR
jgi:hypothetical protein